MDLKHFADAVFSASDPLDPRGFNIKYPQLYTELKEITSFLDSKSTLTQRLWHIHNNILHIPKCNQCDNDSNWNKKHKQYSGYCSTSCRNKSKEFQQKCKDGMVEKYGVDNAMRVDEFKNKQHDIVQNKTESEKQQILEKRQKTNIERFGVKNRLSAPDIKSQYANDNRFSYQSLYSMYVEQRRTAKDISDILQVEHSTVIRHLIKHNIPTIFNRGQIPFEALKILKNPIILKTKHLTEKKSLSEIAYELGVDNSTISKKFQQYNIPVENVSPNTSVAETELVDFITSILPDEKIITNSRNIIHPLELDIYLPEYDLAIEYCGLYWHSSQFKPRYYHKDKLTRCNEKGIRLITIFEDEWIHTKHIVKQKLKNILGVDDNDIVYARKTIPTKITNYQIVDVFYDSYHIQQSPYSKTNSLNVSLQYKNDDVAMMSFTKRTESLYELIRYATKYHIPGGFSKLFNYAKKHLPDNITIISFADLRWSEGQMYHKTGWVLDKQLQPDYSYIEGNRRVHKFNYRHKHLAKKLKIYNPQLSETQNTVNNNVYRIYNCGLLKYKYII